jgi:hypothetical protein
MSKILSAVLITLLLTINYSCKKVEGEGGSSEIIGKVIIRDLDGLGNLIDEYPAQDQRVYIIYGDDDNIYDDDFDTSFDGSFRFQFLTKGTYTLFVYEDCNSCPSGERAVTRTVEIDENNATVEVADLIIKK